MITFCPGCNQSLGCTNRPYTICEECIEKDFEETTGQLCQAKMETGYPEIIICPVCTAVMILSLEYT